MRVASVLIALTTTAAKTPNTYSTANESVSGVPWRRKGAVLDEISPGRLVLFGGKVKDSRANDGRAAFAGDAWLLTLERPEEGGATWTPLAGSEPAGAPAPLARWKAGAAGIGGALYLFGGGSEVGSKTVFFDDLWRLDVSARGPAWTRLPAAGAWPDARRGSWAAPVAGGLVVVGGRTKGHQCFRDAWSFKAATGAWTQAAMPDESDYPCRWGHTATRIPPLASGSPFADGRAAEAVAVFGGRFFEGSEKDFDTNDFVYLNDLWLYDPTADEWALAEATGAQPPKRDHHAAAYVDGGFFVHGGKLTDQAPKALGDLWRYDFAAGTWTEFYTVGPSGRYLHNLAPWPNAPGGGGIVVFGGEHIKSRTKGEKKDGSDSKKKYKRLNDVWFFSPRTGVWTLMLKDSIKDPPLALDIYMPAVRRVVGGLVVLFVLVAVILHVRFSADDEGGHGPPGVTGQYLQ